MKNLLIGNGVNFNSNSDLLTNEKIQNRFVYFFHLFIDDIKQDDLKYKLLESIDLIANFKGNIEEISAIIYKNIENSFSTSVGYFSSNHEQRLKRFLKKVALNAIFKMNNKVINIEINDKYVQRFNQYDTILSINYYDYWDKNNRAIHLHGKIEFDGDEIKNIEKCVFSPLINSPKSKSEVSYPNEHLYPADDFYPMDEYSLYKEFEDLSAIDIFGVSPIGDYELLQAINKVQNIKIYVYDLNARKQEVDSWKKILKQAEYIDSKEFLT